MHEATIPSRGLYWEQPVWPKLDAYSYSYSICMTNRLFWNELWGSIRSVKGFYPSRNLLVILTQPSDPPRRRRSLLHLSRLVPVGPHDPHNGLDL